MNKYILTLFLLTGIQILTFAQPNLEKAKELELKGEFQSAYQSLRAYLDSNTGQLKSDVYLLQFRLLHRLAYDALQQNKPYKTLYWDAVNSLLQAQKLAVTTAEREFSKQEFQMNFSRWLEMGVNQYNIGQFDGAIYWFELCEKLEPNNHDLWNLIIYSLADSNQPKQVINRLIDYYNLGFQSLEIFTIGLQAGVETQQFDLALPWSDFVDEHADSVSRPILIHYDSEAANYWISKQQPKKALYHLQRLIRLTDDEWFKISIAKVYAELKQHSEAVFHLGKVFLPEIQDASVLDYYHSVWLQIQPKKNEFPEYKSWKITPSLVWMKGYFDGKKLVQQEKYTEAQTSIKRSIDENPDFVPAIVLFAQARYKEALAEPDDDLMSKKVLEALPYYERAYSLNPKYPGLSETLKILYESMGDTKNAARFK
ncbi:hypothetical protein EP331_00675 [bacterium]|nr:MAG: hypothetical protein EP331_00675 [bacterium]